MAKKAKRSEVPKSYRRNIKEEIKFFLKALALIIACIALFALALYIN